MTATIIGVQRTQDGEVTTDGVGFVVEFDEHYTVLADNNTDTLAEVLTTAVATDAGVIALMSTGSQVPANGLPVPFQTVYRDNSAICESIGGTKDEQVSRKWTFSARWSSRVDAGSGGNTSATSDPTAAVPTRETLFQIVKRPRHADLVGQPYTNGAKTLFNPPLVTEIELPRYDFTQFNAIYEQEAAIPGGDISTTHAGLPPAGIGKLTEADYTSTPGTIFAPGIYNAGVFQAWTDDTVAYLNGAVNSLAFLFKQPYTWLLKVKKSTVSYFYTGRMRITEFSLVYDKNNHWDKPINAGPFFTAVELDAAGAPVIGQFVKYPYIYFTGDVEHADTDLVHDKLGLLGYRNLLLQYNNATGAMERNVTMDEVDGQSIAGYKLVTTADGKKTHRAVRPDPANATEQYYIEYVNHDLADFNAMLRVI